MHDRDQLLALQQIQEVPAKEEFDEAFLWLGRSPALDPLLLVAAVRNLVGPLAPRRD